MKNKVLLIGAMLLTAGLSCSALAEDFYGFLMVEKGGNYTIRNDFTTDASFPLLDDWAQSTKVSGLRPGYVKFRLRTLTPATNRKLENTKCRADSYWQAAWAPCSAYLNLEDHFVKVGSRDHATSNYWNVSFLNSDYQDALKEAFGKRGFDNPMKSGRDAWLKRVADVEAALAVHKDAEDKIRRDVLTEIRISESAMGEFEPIITYTPFKAKLRPDTFPPLFGDLAQWADLQEKDRQAWANDTLAQFKSYFEPLQVEAERSYAAKLAQKKADDLAREKADREFQARLQGLAIERENRSKLEAAEHQRQVIEEAKRVVIFRSKIKVESETNCGPVIAVRGSLIQVANSVQGYGNEHWIRRTELFPPGYDCWFLNGKYVGTQRP